MIPGPGRALAVSMLSRWHWSGKTRGCHEARSWRRHVYSAASNLTGMALSLPTRRRSNFPSALAICEKALRPDHSNTVRVRSILASLLRNERS